MGRLYTRLALGIQTLIILVALFLFILLHPETTRLLGEKVLKPNGLIYRQIDGNLLIGFQIFDLRYADAFYAKKVAIAYHLFSLLSQRPTIESLDVDRPRIYPNRFPTLEDQASKNSESTLPPILLKKITLQQGTLFLSHPTPFSLRAKETLYDHRKLTIKHFDLVAKESDTTLTLQGTYHQPMLTAKGFVRPKEPLLHKLSSTLIAPPRAIPFSLRYDGGNLHLASELEALRFKDLNGSLKEIELRAIYHLHEAYLEADLKYHLRLGSIKGDATEYLVATPTLAYATTIRLHLLERAITQGIELPAKQMVIKAAGDRETLTADVTFGPFQASIYSTDYERFDTQLHANGHQPLYLKRLTPFFKHQTMHLKSDAIMHIHPTFSLKGTLELEGNYSKTKAFVEYSPNNFLVKALLIPLRPDQGFWNTLPHALQKEVHAYLYHSRENTLFNLSSYNAYLTLFKQSNRIKGWANIASLTLDTQGTIDKTGTIFLDFHTHIDSLHAMLQDLNITTSPFIDAETDDIVHLTLSEDVAFSYEISIPWYLVQLDSQNVYYGLNSSLQGTFKNGRIDIDHYDIGILQRRLKSDRLCTLILNDSGRLTIEKIALWDTGRLEGLYDFRKKRGSLHFIARAMHLRQPEANVTLDADILSKIDEQAIDTEGNITLLGGVVTYLPKTSHTITDEDIIVIQDIKEPSHTRKSVDIHIESAIPLHYHIPMADIHFRPDITLYKVPLEPLEILGRVHIEDGKIHIEKKHFMIEPSDIYFGGGYPINPYLDLKIRYDLDFKRFYIYIGHTLSDPLFLFSSEPPMNQNDIISYILFGAPADDAFKGGNENIGTMLLGLGLKNAIGSATGLAFDTFNILETPEGSFGVEIGKRFGRLRILYRNDSLSSFILQYTLSRSLRADLEVRQTGQGVNLLYIKDLKGPASLMKRWR